MCTRKWTARKREGGFIFIGLSSIDSQSTSASLARLQAANQPQETPEVLSACFLTLLCSFRCALSHVKVARYLSCGHTTQVSIQVLTPKPRSTCKYQYKIPAISPSGDVWHVKVRDFSTVILSMIKTTKHGAHSGRQREKRPVATPGADRTRRITA